MEPDYAKLFENLENPPEEFSPVPFWFLNDEFDEEALRSQMLDFKSKGVGGVVLHPRIGVPESVRYLSAEYFGVLRFIVRTARELEMKIVLYDEGMYPSGSAHGGVVAANPSFAARGATLTYSSGGETVASFPDGARIAFMPSGGTIRGIHFGEDDGQPGAPLAADILNPEAVGKFIELTHERHFAELGEFFGDTVTGFFTDEPCPLGRNVSGFIDWYDGLERDLAALGFDVPDLRALFDGGNNALTAAYRRLITQRLRDVYYKPLSRWCKDRSISLMGHPAASDDIDEEEYFHIPGQDLVFRQVSPEKGGITGRDCVQAKCSSDAARHSGRRRNSNECFGVCVREGIPWYLTAGDMKWFIDWLGVRGVNLFIPHAFYYSLRGERKNERPPDVGPNNIWWEHYKLFSDYIKRVSYIMTDSQNSAALAVICESGDMPALPQLFETQTEFNYLPLSLLGRCRVSDGVLSIAGYDYSCVLSEKARPELYSSGVKVISRPGDAPPADFVCVPKCRDLRVTRLKKDGIDMLFAVNEGEEDLDADVSLTAHGAPVLFDLWRATRFAPAYTSGAGRISFRLRLRRRESALIVFGGDAEPEEAGTVLRLEPELVSHDEAAIKKTYRAAVRAESVTGSETAIIEAEEMVECYVGGVFAGVSFWNPHTFRIGGLLHSGANEITLVVTGNAANRYESSVAYGIKGVDLL